MANFCNYINTNLVCESNYTDALFVCKFCGQRTNQVNDLVHSILSPEYKMDLGSGGEGYVLLVVPEVLNVRDVPGEKQPNCSSIGSPAHLQPHLRILSNVDHVLGRASAC